MIHGYPKHENASKVFVLFHSKQFLFSPAEKSLRKKVTYLSTLYQKAFFELTTILKGYHK